MSIRNNKQNLSAMMAGFLGWMACVYYDLGVLGGLNAALIVANGLYGFSDLNPKLGDKT